MTVRELRLLSLGDRGVAMSPSAPRSSDASWRMTMALVAESAFTGRPVCMVERRLPVRSLLRSVGLRPVTPRREGLLLHCENAAPDGLIGELIGTDAAFELRDLWLIGVSSDADALAVMEDLRQVEGSISGEVPSTEAEAMFTMFDGSVLWWLNARASLGRVQRVVAVLGDNGITVRED